MRFVKSAIAAACASAAIAAATAPAASGAIAAQGVRVGAVGPAGLVTPPPAHVTPDPSAPGTATTFEVFCGRDAMSATLFGATLGLADLILMHSAAAAMPGEFVVTVTLPANIAPGTYHPSFDCSNGFAGTTTLHVNPVPVQAPATGDGTTATQTGTALTSIGYGMIGLGALAGAWAIALRRRAVQRH